MENVIIVIILAAIVGGIVRYLYRAKRSGQKCVGCPYSKKCKDSCGACEANSTEHSKKV